jgi:hypothetical protein
MALPYLDCGMVLTLPESHLGIKPYEYAFGLAFVHK